MISQRAKLIVSAATICLAWGASYLAIRIGEATMPPMSLGFIRYFIAGALLWIWSERRGDSRPTPRQWASSAALGMCFVVIGNGSVLWAEQTVPSGVAALIVAAGPSWTMLIEWSMGRRPRPGTGSLAGLLLGLAGVALLVGSRGGGSGGTIAPLPAIVVLVGAFGWALGANLSPRLERPTSALRSLSAQMLLGSAALLLLAGLRGELRPGQWGPVTVSGVLALGYLVLVASIAAYVAYNWIVHNVSPTAASISNYVNPAIAVLLGAAYGEPLYWRHFVALGLITVGVALLSRIELRRKQRETLQGGQCSKAGGHSLALSAPRDGGEPPAKHESNSWRAVTGRDESLCCQNPANEERDDKREAVRVPR